MKAADSKDDLDLLKSELLGRKRLQEYYIKYHLHDCRLWDLLNIVKGDLNIDAAK